MPEQRIVITIDEQGKISASTEGLKGEVCLDELQKILGEEADLGSLSKTDEFYQSAEQKTQQKINTGRK
jgi:hypothetical protein